MTVRAVAFEEAGVWVVQGVDYDICAHAETAAAVPQAFARALAENARIAAHLGREPMAGVKPAPARFEQLFEGAVTQVRSVGKPDLLERTAFEFEIRLAQPHSIAA